MFVHQILLVQHGLRMFTVPWRIRMYGYVWYKLMLTWLGFLLMGNVAIYIYVYGIHTDPSWGLLIPHDYVRWPPSPCLASVHCSTSGWSDRSCAARKMGGIPQVRWMVFVRENPIIRNGWWLVEFTPLVNSQFLRVKSWPSRVRWFTHCFNGDSPWWCSFS